MSNPYANSISWGMIGCGSVTEKKSAPAFNKIDHSKLVAVHNRSLSKAQDYAARHGNPKVHEKAHDLIHDPDVNAIYIATPPGSHLEYAMESIRAGKAVYLEKPMALNGEQCRQINQAAAEKRVPVFVAYYRRGLEYFKWIKELIDSGSMGGILNIQMDQYYAARPEDYDASNLPWRVIPAESGGGYFHDLGCHALDIIFYIFGDPLKECGRCTNFGGLYDAPDQVSAHLLLPGGIHVNGSWGFVHPEPYQKDRVIVYGEKGRLQFSIFTFEAIELEIGSEEKIKAFVQPEHIQMPLIQSIVDELRGKGSCPSSGESAELTSQVMDQICNE